MVIQIVTPSPAVHGVATGNRSTASQWASLCEDLGHATAVRNSFDESLADTSVLVALHCVKSHESIVRFRSRHPARHLVVALTGTDLYTDLTNQALESMRLADRLIVLQAKALNRVPGEFRSKTRVIVQSAEPLRTDVAPVARGVDPFDICVVGHLRDVKDPLRAAAASRILPADSRIRIRHAGGILDSKYEELVRREERENSRYHWMQELAFREVRDLIFHSQLMVISSHLEGGARVVGESIVEGTPVLASRIDGVTGLVGDHYPGLFPVGDTKSLAGLMTKAETERGFLQILRDAAERLAPQFDPRLERQAWRELIAELSGG